MLELLLALLKLFGYVSIAVVVVVLLLTVGVFSNQLEAPEFFNFLELCVEDSVGTVWPIDAAYPVDSLGQPFRNPFRQPLWKTVWTIYVFQETRFRSRAAPPLQPNFMLSLQISHIVARNFDNLLRTAAVMTAVDVL